MNKVKQIILLGILMFNTPLLGQDEDKSVPLPIFEPFKGTVYEMPELEQINGKSKSIKIQEYYSDTIYSYPVIGDITLEKLNVPETYVKKGKFPGVDRRIKFAMILHSKMQVQLDACYEFKITSDDGSRMWIDEIQVIQNDGGHGMKTKKDTVALTRGHYDVKVWYFQGMPDRFGLEMDTKIIGKVETCSNYSLETKKAFRKIVFDYVFFDSDQYTLTSAGKLEIARIAAIINKSDCKSIKIIGHTDTQGESQYNKTLSYNRAVAVSTCLQRLTNNQQIEFIIIGRGETESIDDNATIEGRKKNRRVELFLID